MLRNFRILALAIFAVALPALALTATDRAALRAQMDAIIDALPVDAAPPPPPPPAAWPRNKPDLLDLDLVNQDSILYVKWLDGTIGAGFNGAAVHYGAMAGAVDNWQPFVIDSKLSNPSCPPKWGVEPNGMHFLEVCTDGAKEPQPQVGCKTCRMINWGFAGIAVKEIYWRGLEYVYPETLANTTDLGIKGTGVGGTLVNGGTFAELFEYGDITKDATRAAFPGQAYRYDLEANQGVSLFPGFKYQPGRWYTNEGHVKVPTCATCADGVIEFKVDGVLVFSRTDVKMGAAFITGFSPQLYHGGLKAPAGMLRFKIARIAVSKSNWIGPAPEFGP
jgi:hypothetical protein